MSAPRFAISLVLSLCLALVALCPARADELTPQKQADIQRLLDVSGGAALGKQLPAVITRQVVLSLKQKRPDIPAQSLAVVEREVMAVMKQKLEGPGGMLDRLVPLYAKTFTQQEIKDMLAFYESPTGRKAAAALPGLLREGQKIGEELAKEIGPELKRRLTEALSKEGVVLDRLPD
ncbi:MAG TPA: DUF2059 domain-containing protein [Humidesulfovibrio sp.]|uniref:DUF2059 domain-containing protein n=1 Tax=Humidesulfovibrio sp. TaxID=2910988 RepID=UPI002CDF8563|nr:DUF2059 domain-containing protein [Humidesulfovibrio sp.]HWR04715.1 DUF2059 domain-containing protein [Humidesulfovibrio sp.]